MVAAGTLNLIPAPDIDEWSSSEAFTDAIAHRIDSNPNIFKPIVMSKLDRHADIARNSSPSNFCDHRGPISPPKRTASESRTYSSNGKDRAGRSLFKMKSKDGRRGLSCTRNRSEDVDGKRRKNRRGPHSRWTTTTTDKRRIHLQQTQAAARK